MADAGDTIIDRLREILRENAAEEHDWDAVTAETSFEELGIDSLVLLDLLYDIDQEFGITLEAKQVVGLTTVGAVAELLQPPSS